MKKRVFWSILLTAFIVLAVAVAVVTLTVYGEFTEERKTEIRTEAEYISEAYKTAGIDYLNTVGHDSKNRLTLIAADGRVLYDNTADESTLGSHADRPEFKDALADGSGEIVRRSDTLGDETFYYALKLSSGEVLRVAATMKSIIRLLDSTSLYTVLTVVLALIIAVIAANGLTKRIVAPIVGINIENPLDSETYGELSPLLIRMDKQKDRIEYQMKELSRAQNEFAKITDGMKEALMVFGVDRRLLFANGSAKALFESHCMEGEGYLEICRDGGYIRALEAAFDGRRAETRLERGGRIYFISADPVNDGGTSAAVVFASDVTEKEQSETMRREFSANVSHELKTPLSSVLGCAEMIRDGIAKSEDVPRFAGQIYDEATRLLTLIEDIIKLSRLDEGGVNDSFEKLDITAIARKVGDELAAKANSLGVSLTVEGESARINGIATTLREMIFNLCDNALTYNKKGGFVRVSVASENEKITLSVADSGIGIPPEHQARVFERFYRVDKSRSKESGGTGLGLSIVKHGAALHGADIELESTVGEGTTVRIIFKKQ